MQIDIHALSGFRTNDTSVQKAKTFCALDHVATVIGIVTSYECKYEGGFEVITPVLI
jgi:hypothetical protein